MSKAKRVYIDIIYSILAIMLCLAIGKAIYHYFGGLPGSLYGMIVLNLLLYFQLVDQYRIKATIEWVIQNMGVCFVPAGVGIINHFDLVAKHGLAIVSVIFISTMVLITFVGFAVQKCEAKSIRSAHVD
ncbi:CidA/LrgA family protein [Thalassotalea sp. PLHSN55]|uniref:CidA/LrgA family protein n=1 Tax=Thalassotalea sp. PLHSN55 TaxID=3435888 RepID=UPI003F82FA2C